MSFNAQDNGRGEIIESLVSRGYELISEKPAYAIFLCKALVEILISRGLEGPPEKRTRSFWFHLQPEFTD